MEKVLITVLGGVCEVYACNENVEVEIIDFDNEPNAEIPQWAIDKREKN